MTTYFEITETARGVSEADAQELLFPIARENWLLAVRDDGKTPTSECQIRLAGSPPVLYVSAGGWVQDREDT